MYHLIPIHDNQDESIYTFHTHRELMDFLQDDWETLISLSMYRHIQHLNPTEYRAVTIHCANGATYRLHGSGAYTPTSISFSAEHTGTITPISPPTHDNPVISDPPATIQTETLPSPTPTQQTPSQFHNTTSRDARDAFAMSAIIQTYLDGLTLQTRSTHHTLTNSLSRSCGELLTLADAIERDIDNLYHA